MSNHDDLTRTLSRELSERAETMDGSLVHLADVQGRARSIRRRRTATAVAGVAAAVAVIIPTVSLATHTSGKPEPGPATHSPSPTQTAKDDGHQPPTGVLDVSDLPTGAAPGIEYVTDGTVLHRADGSTVDIPTKYPVSSFTTLTDGTHLWLTADADGTPYVEVQDAEGNLHDPVRSGWSLTVNSSHSLGAWTRVDGQVMVWNAGATEPLEYGDPVPAGNDLRMGPVLGDHCGAPDDTCEVYVNVPAESGWQPWLVSVNGTEQSRDGSYLILSDSTESGLSVGKTKLSDFGSCSDLLGGGEFQGFHTCKAQFESFSPDGSALLAYAPNYDGLGPTSVSIWDLQGQPLFERKSDAEHQATVTNAQWEDDSHLIASVFQENTWSLVRIATDGTMEYAVPPVAGGEEDGFVLETR